VEEVAELMKIGTTGFAYWDRKLSNAWRWGFVCGMGFSVVLLSALEMWF
jgi:hypothetical protein